MWLKDYEVPSVSQSNIQEYRFCRVPFGVISSPFLLGVTVEHHLEQCNTATALRLKDNIYVDNLITGTDSEHEAIQLYQCSKTIFQDASLNLREWLSNSNTVNHLISERDRAKSETMTVLGYVWNSTADVMSMKSPTKMNMGSKHITKRKYLESGGLSV